MAYCLYYWTEGFEVAGSNMAGFAIGIHTFKLKISAERDNAVLFPSIWTLNS